MGVISAHAIHVIMQSNDDTYAVTRAPSGNTLSDLPPPHESPHLIIGTLISNNRRSVLRSTDTFAAYNQMMSACKRRKTRSVDFIVNYV